MIIPPPSLIPPTLTWALVVAKVIPFPMPAVRWLKKDLIFLLKYGSNRSTFTCLKPLVTVSLWTRPSRLPLSTSSLNGQVAVLR